MRVILTDVNVLTLQEIGEEDKEEANKHFEHWDTFWGRPGHGAPRPVKVRESLDYILYQLPILIRKDISGATTDDEDSEKMSDN